MRRCHFARHDGLQTRVQAVCHQRLAAHAGVFQNQHPALGFLRRDELAGSLDFRPHVGPFPEIGHQRRLGYRGHQVMQHLPQRGRTFFKDAFIKGLTLRREIGFHHCRHGASMGTLIGWCEVRKTHYFPPFPLAVRVTQRTLSACPAREKPPRAPRQQRRHAAPVWRK